MAPGVDAIIGFKDGGGSEVQALRFDAGKFSPSEARAWAKDHDMSGTLEAAKPKKRFEFVGDDAVVDIVKSDEAKQIVYGWASVSQIDGQTIVDLQNDMIEPEDLEDTAVEHMLHHRESGVMHEGAVVGKVIASMVTTPDVMKAAFGIEPNVVGWLIGVKYSDPAVFKRVVAGELPFFSIQGRAERETVAR